MHVKESQARRLSISHALRAGGLFAPDSLAPDPALGELMPESKFRFTWTGKDELNHAKGDK